MKYNNKIFNSSGFSLAEALVVMFVVCTVAVAATPALTKYSKKLGQSTSHGTYICYGGNTMKQRYAGGVETTMPTSCKFKLRKSNAYYRIKAVGGGSANVPGQYVVKYLPKADSELIITGGKAGENIVITSKDTGNTLLTALGGNENFGSNRLYYDNIKSCALTNAPASCAKGRYSGCEKTLHPTTKAPSLRVMVCDTTDSTEENDEWYVTENSQGRYCDSDSRCLSGPNASGIYTYNHPNKSGMNIAIEFYDSSFPNTGSTAVSGLMEELATIGSTSPQMLQALKSSGAGNKSRPGAVLIQW